MTRTVTDRAAHHAAVIGLGLMGCDLAALAAVARLGAIARTRA